MHPGTIVAERFELERLAGSGGMGTVWQANDRLEGTTVALKFLDFAGSVPHVQRFLREGRLLAELRHPGIVRYVASGATPEACWLAMEWLEGEDLAARLARAPLTLDESLTLVGRAAAALGFAHGRGVVHRDVKPGNLFLLGGKASDVRILDFGVAHLGPNVTALTRTGMLVGTPGYMAPEQVRADPVDARTDVFALGTVLFECVTGRPAFCGPSPAALLAKILLEEAPPVSDLAPEAPRLLDKLVARMLAKDPSKRPADGTELAAEVEVIWDATPHPHSIAPSRPSLTTGERRLVSVVMAGSSPYAPTLATGGASPGAPNRRLAALPTGAKIEQMLDGSAVAVVTGPGSATDLAARAARTALLLRAELGAVPMGLATGRAVVGGRVPVGPVIDRAAELSRIGGAGVVRIDDVTAGLLDARFDVRDDEAGYRLVGEREAPDTVRTLLGRPTPFVGRAQELGTLEAVFAGCVDESVARVVLVTGAAGVGKSRLRRELVARIAARGDGVELWIGRGDPTSAGSPLGMVAQAIRRAAGLLGGESIEVRRDKLVEWVGRRVSREERARVAEFVGELVGTPFPDEDSVQLRAARADAMLMGDQIRRAVEDLADAECRARPVMLVLEDLHWGDLPTVQLVDRLLRNLSAHPFVVLALARPSVRELFPAMWVERPLTELRLGGLSHRACERLARTVLGADVGDERLRVLVERADGNAFFLEELVRAAAEDSWDALPHTVVAMVQARLERLEPEARRLLRAASVFGGSFWRGGLVELLGAVEIDVDGWLEILVERELVTRRRTARFPGETEYAFRHALLREAAYGMLTEADRSLGHRLAGGWLERSGETDALVLAEHFEKGDQPGRAVGWYLSAAEQALEAHDHEAAIARAERGAANGADGEVLGAFSLMEAEAHFWRGSLAEVERCGLAAMASLPTGSTRWFQAAWWVGRASVRLGHRDRIDALATALQSVESDTVASPAETARIVALATMVAELLLVGRRELAGALLGRIVPSSRSLVELDPSAAAAVHAARAWEALFAGDLDASVEERELAAREYERAGNLRGAWAERGHVGFAKLELGLHSEAERDLRTVFEAARRLGLHGVTVDARANLGLALARQGRLKEAREVEEEALEASRAQAYRPLEGVARTYLARILVLAGELDAALREARAGVELLAATPPGLPCSLGTLAQVHLLRGELAEAAAKVSEALDRLASTRGVEEGLIRLVHAEVEHATGREEDARRAIADARRRLLERASRIEDPERRKCFLENVPEHTRTFALAREWLGEDA